MMPHIHLRVQIPAYNEKATLSAVARGALRAADSLQKDGIIGQVSVLIVDDGSHDGSEAIAQKLAETEKAISVLRHERRAGLGRTFRAGLRHALDQDVDILVHIDADGQFDPLHMGALCRPILSGEAHLVTASRFSSVAPVPPVPWVRRVGNRSVAMIVSRLGRIRVRDASCGFRAFSRAAMETMRLSSDFTYTHQTLISCGRQGLKVEEVALAIQGRRAQGKSKVAPGPLLYGLRAGAGIARTWLEHRTERPSSE